MPKKNTKYAVWRPVISVAVPKGATIDEDGHVILPDGTPVAMVLDVKLNARSRERADVYIRNIGFPTPTIEDEEVYV